MSPHSHRHPAPRPAPPATDGPEPGTLRPEPGWPDSDARRYREAGYWEGRTFGTLLRDLAAAHPDREAVSGGGQRWTYRELDDRADLMAAGLLHRGIRRGDRVVLQLPNVPEFFEVLFALLRVGVLPVFALPGHRGAEITHFCRVTEAVAYVTADTDPATGFDFRELASEVRATVPTLRHVLVLGEPGDHTPLRSVPADHPTGHPEPEPGDVAFLQLSGGSTGVPKLIPRTHDDYLYSLRGSAEICRLGPDSCYLAVLPLAHNYPLSSPGVLGTLYAGGRVVCAPQPSPDTAFPLIEQERVTITGLVPPLALIWLRAAESGGHDLSSLEVLQVGGAPFPAEAASRVRPVFGATLQQVFGMAEGLVNYTRLDDPDELTVHTQGRPISPDDEIRIVDDGDRPVPEGDTGHLLTRGPYTIRGYYRAPEHNARAFTPDGFYRTGDLVRRTAEGYLVVEGRHKDQINRGGDKVAAEEVENHLLAHPGVHDVAVVGLPDDFLGERTCAFVVAAGEPPLRRTLTQFLRERQLAAFKVPDVIRFVHALPLTPLGKVDKTRLRTVGTAPPVAPR